MFLVVGGDGYEDWVVWCLYGDVVGLCDGGGYVFCLGGFVVLFYIRVWEFGGVVGV